MSQADHLSVAQVRQFQRDGYLFPLPVLEEAQVNEFMRRYLEYVSANKARLDALAPKDKYQVLSETHFILPWVHQIITHPRLLDRIESLLGPNLLAWNTTWFTKMPGEKTYVSWHQDGTYWNLRPAEVVTAWVALSPATSANGCMRVIPGTHTKPAMAHRETYDPDNALSRGQDIAVKVDEAQAVDLQLQPGEASLHHIWIVHGSNANLSTTPRIGIAIRYTRPEVVQESPVKPLAMLVRGRDDHHNFELLSPPERENDPASLQAHAAIVNRIRSSILKDAKTAR